MELDLFRGPGVALVTVLLFGVGLAQARPSRAVLLARSMVGLGLLFAARTLVTLPSEFLAVRANLQYRQAFYENVAFMPLLAVVALVALVVIHNVAGVTGASPSLRTWAISRGQLLIGALVILGQLVLVNRAVCPACVEVPWAAALAFIAAALAASLVQQFWRQRYDETRGA